jgi:hypothetical protein
MLLSLVIVSALFLVVVNSTALGRHQAGVGRATLLSAALIVPCMCLLGWPLVLNPFLVAVAGAVCWVAGARPRWFLASSLGATAAFYGVIAWGFAMPEVREWERQKAAHPMESLAGRLKYEDRPRSPAVVGAHEPGRLAHFEECVERKSMEYPAEGRTEALERLHAHVVRHFIESPGFGVGRMRPRSPRELESIERSESLQEGNPGPVPQAAPLYLLPEPSPGTPRPAEPDLAAAHEQNALAFLNPFNFGYVRDREHVAGFRPHQFRYRADAPARWRVERLELVGLLKYDDPVVYLSENLPAMDELRDAPTRPLDAFEQQALTALRGGEDLMAQDGPNRMRLLGSLRAVKQCVRCHDVERGELLGAFSYRLAREENRQGPSPHE